jgi:ATP-dependent Clp protease ATP-binding subunit ClpC
VDVALIALLAVGVVAIVALVRARTHTKAQPAAAHSEPAQPDEPPPSLADLPRLGEAMRATYEASSHPHDLEAEPNFQRGVAILSDPQVSPEQVADYAVGANHHVAMMAACALWRRADSGAATPRLIAHLRHTSLWTGYYLLRCLAEHADRPVIAPVVLCARDWWQHNPLVPPILSAFIEQRLAAGEQPDLAAAASQHPPDSVEDVQGALAALRTPAADALLAQLREWRRGRVDTDFLESIGRIWSADDWQARVADTPSLRAGVTLALDALQRTPPQSLLLVGEAGVGKTALMRAIAQRLADAGWTILEATAADVIAGQTYIGELEHRMRKLLANLETGKRILWYVPDFHELYYTGQHRFSPIGILDLVLPAVEQGRLCMVGEVRPAALERVLQQRPRLRLSFKSLLFEPASDEQSLALAAAVAREQFAPAGVSVDPALLREALDLARHTLSSSTAPGNLLDLLRQTCTRLTAHGGGPRAMTRQDLLLTLSQITGLPRSVLDEREGLDAPGLRAFFEQRVMGQPEAVGCLVDRVAMLKAGLTDPNRPIGVFLFAGPTGTGKTEVAKTLAQYLFGSAERMIRLDMSEFQEPQSLTRIVGEAGERAETNALVNRIRKQPFSVVLLDEFEKAHPRVWDLFLQVFDDARLTDAQGNVADFRHSIIILTTNLGAVEHQGGSLGFTLAGGAFSEAQVLRVIANTFRPEFVNRIDRVVVFRPLSKAVMRDILRKELSAVLQRRGFRSREWAVEWEDSAIEFLLARGFTRDMGARPLRRAVDQHVLAPIAMTIVEHRFPEGDQFLFVRSDGIGIQVEFVDPDAPPAPAPPAASIAPAGALSYAPIVLAPSGSAAEQQFLAAALAALEQRLEQRAWIEEKQRLLQDMSSGDFWTSARRHQVLTQIEHRDSIEAGCATAQSLMRRLTSRAGRLAAPPSILSNLAQQLYLLERALADLERGLWPEVFLGVEAVAGDARGETGDAKWGTRVFEMYREWARKRRMRAHPPEGAGAAQLVLAVSGFGAHGILLREVGLHVLEIPDDQGGFARQTTRVRVVPQPAAPRTAQHSELAQALACLSAAQASSNAVVRRYRERPSPLVRDAVAGWRTGRLEQVLGGDFDLME